MGVVSRLGTCSLGKISLASFPAPSAFACPSTPASCFGAMLTLYEIATYPVNWSYATFEAQPLRQELSPPVCGQLGQAGSPNARSAYFQEFGLGHLQCDLPRPIQRQQRPACIDNEWR